MGSKNLGFILLALASVWFLHKQYQKRMVTAPQLTLKSTDSKDTAFPVKGPAIYVLWTTWCPACSGTLKQAFLQDPLIKDKIYLINDGEDEQLVLRTLAERNYPFKSLLDPKRHFARSMKANSYPSFFIQNSKGQIKPYEFNFVYNPENVKKEWINIMIN